MFLLCMVISLLITTSILLNNFKAEVHGLFTPGLDIIASCQERVMHKDNHGLLHELVRLKELVDQLAYVFHKISVNPHSGENFGMSPTHSYSFDLFPC